jgi:hypothetical protein
VVSWAAAVVSASTVIIDYTNWKGTRAEREINPIRIAFESTEWHGDDKWILHAIDVAKGEERSFLMDDIHVWRPAASDADDTPFDAPTIAGGFPLDREEKRVIEAGYQRYGTPYTRRFDTIEEAHDFLDGGDSVGTHSSVAVFVDGVAVEFEEGSVQRDALRQWWLSVRHA